MRKYYIDNLRIICILLLFPFHTTMIFNTLGETFYVNGTPNEILSFVNFGTYAWWMTGLFVLAGMSTVYSLEGRTVKQYFFERVKKIFIPLISCIIFVIPMQTYIADIFHNGYQGNYFEHLKVFFKITDFGGYDGHFTTGNCWFSFYLFVISVVALPIIFLTKDKVKKINAKYLNMPVILLLGIPFYLFNNILDIGGKSFAQFGFCFLAGFFVFSNEKVLDRLEKNSTVLGILWVLLIVIRCILHVQGMWETIWNAIAYYLLGWIGILAIIGLSRRFLNHNWKFTKCFTKAIYPLYLFHQTIVVTVGYFIIQNVTNVYLSYILIIIISFVITYLLYLLCRSFRVTRFMFGIKKVNGKSEKVQAFK